MDIEMTEITRKSRGQPKKTQTARLHSIRIKPDVEKQLLDFQAETGMTNYSASLNMIIEAALSSPVISCRIKHRLAE